MSLRHLATALAVAATPAAAVEVTVTIENLATGTYLTPVWIGVHDGAFDLYDAGAPASTALERLAEDGAADALKDAFDTASGGMSGLVFGAGGPIAPGETTSLTLDLDPTASYLSYASMVIPSNDAFIANGDPQAIPLFDERGTFRPRTLILYGRDVLDAGTELNDELPENTAFFGQAAPDTGVSEGGVVEPHPGLLSPAAGGILADPMFGGADFTEHGYPVARLTVSTATGVTVTIENLSPVDGTYLTPVWVGFHDGTFVVTEVGSTASAALERVAEDGDTGPLATAFADSDAGDLDATVLGPGGPIAPGETASMTFTLDGSRRESRFLSFASMVIPSNDAFIANGDPRAIPVFDGRGRFLGGELVIRGDEVLDAGTELNDELPANTAFFGQAAPDTGVTEAATVARHPGLLPADSGGVLADPAFAAADFTARKYRLARIRVRAPGQPSVRLRDERFRVSATFDNPTGEPGTALAQALTDESATLTFFDDENVELVVKIIDGCTFNDRFWVFSSGLTDVPVELTVEDLESGTEVTYAAIGGEPFPPVLDTTALATCP